MDTRSRGIQDRGYVMKMEGLVTPNLCTICSVEDPDELTDLASILYNVRHQDVTLEQKRWAYRDWVNINWGLLSSSDPNTHQKTRSTLFDQLMKARGNDYLRRGYNNG